MTFMVEVERILNDRPLVCQDNHPDDLDPLTGFKPGSHMSPKKFTKDFTLE